MNTTAHLTMAIFETARAHPVLRPMDGDRSERTGTVVALPRRIDVHRVDELVDELVDGLATVAARTGLLEVDGSAVEMIDGAGLAALERLSGDTNLVVRDASVALAKTAQYTGHDRLHAACLPVATFDAAA